jgi:hypothetical protein
VQVTKPAGYKNTPVTEITLIIGGLDMPFAIASGYSTTGWHKNETILAPHP